MCLLCQLLLITSHRPPVLWISVMVAFGLTWASDTLKPSVRVHCRLHFGPHTEAPFCSGPLWKPIPHNWSEYSLIWLDLFNNLPLKTSQPSFRRLKCWPKVTTLGTQSWPCRHVQSDCRCCIELVVGSVWNAFNNSRASIFFWFQLMVTPLELHLRTEDQVMSELKFHEISVILPVKLSVSQRTLSAWYFGSNGDSKQLDLSRAGIAPGTRVRCLTLKRNFATNNEEKGPFPQWMVVTKLLRPCHRQWHQTSPCFACTFRSSQFSGIRCFNRTVQ